MNPLRLWTNQFNSRQTLIAQAISAYEDLVTNDEVNLKRISTIFYRIQPTGRAVVR